MNRTERHPATAPLFVISGPSGVGKTSLVDKLVTQTQLPIRKAVTATTRQPRPGELDGIHYHFWTREQFEKAINDQELLEYAVVHGQDYYGTPVSEVEPFRAQGSAVILVIDVQGAKKVREKYPCPNDLQTIFLKPPTIEELQRRLTYRGTDTPETIARRLRTAENEMAQMEYFDIVVENSDLDEATRLLDNILTQQFHSARRSSSRC